MRDLAGERVDYLGAHLLESAAPAEPIALFEAWLADAFAARDQGLLTEPTAMVVATCDDGRPSARTVLLKSVSAEGFVFFTNYDSRKAAEISRRDHVALHFGWYALHRQVRVEGRAERVSRADSEAYFHVRPRGSQLGAWASAQSSTVDSLAELTAAYAAAEERFAGREVPCPEHWGGYRVTPEMIEFWQGQPSRMHDRLVYRRTDSVWSLSRLAP
jgi:pyridoxamine 5'-phosphate oxidase